jgi:serine/threonine protein kinase
LAEEQSKLGKVKDWVLEHKVLVSGLAGTAMFAPILKYYLDIFENNTDFKTGLGFAWETAKCYASPYLVLDAAGYFFHSENKDRLNDWRGLNSKQKFLEESASVSREPAYYLKLASMDCRAGDEKSAVKNLNNAFDSSGLRKLTDNYSIFSKLIKIIFPGKAGGAEHSKNMMQELANVPGNASDLEKIISAAAFAISEDEENANAIVSKIESKDERAILLKAQTYAACFKKYKDLAGKELEKIFNTSKLIPFSDRHRNKLFVLDVKDEAFNDQILVKTSTHSDSNAIEKEYELTSLFHYYLHDMIPRPFGLVEKQGEKYLFMKKIEGMSYQRYFKENGVSVDELARIVYSVAKYQPLGDVILTQQNRHLVEKYDLRFNFTQWFESSVRRLYQSDADFDKSKSIEYLDMKMCLWALDDFLSPKTYFKFNDSKSGLDMSCFKKVGMHGDFTIDNIMRKNTGEVTIIDSERFKLGLGWFDLFNILEDTRLNLRYNDKLLLFGIYSTQAGMLSLDLKDAFRFKELLAPLVQKYSAVYYPKQMATAIMFYDYYRDTGKEEFAQKARHHVACMKLSPMGYFGEETKIKQTEDAAAVDSFISGFRDSALSYLKTTPLKDFM